MELPDAITKHSAVKDVYGEHIRVRPYGNAAVFNRMRRKGIRFGNVTTFENGDLKVNIRG